ncbi:NAD(P)-binding domain-containing protein [Sphingosinicellaceae bacterium]|nr:NAD(P)-binding domain-containing protein [Sphingosinicellaceae bacterium]
MRTAIIGAGCSGFTTAKRLQDEGLEFDWYEASDRIGGNWAYANPNGMSSAYQSLHIDTSKTRLQFEDYSVPADWPDFPHHSLIAKYFNDYVDHFGLRPLIRFETPVTSVARRDDGRWDVTSKLGTEAYDAVVVANGHHWSPNRPEWPGRFDGTVIHAHDYRTPTDPVDMTGKRVVVVGLGNSAVDIAAELAQRTVTERLFVSARRGVWVLPKMLGGRPIDKTPLPAWIPPKLARKLAAGAVRRAVGNMTDYGLPEPDHAPLHAHPTVSAEFLPRCAAGDIVVRPGIAALEGPNVRFSDGSVEAVDVIVTATGYRVEFPFLSPEDAPVTGNHLPLFKRMVQPEPARHGLWFMGLAQSLPTLVNLAEQQSKLFVAWASGQYALPDEATMRRVIASDETLHRGHYYASPRHTMQLDFGIYVRDIQREIASGATRVQRVAA